MKRSQVVYKIVKVRADGALRSCMHEYCPPFNMEYSATELNRPAHGKIFVFETLSHAESWVCYNNQYHEIYRCIGYNVEDISRVVSDSFGFRVSFIPVDAPEPYAQRIIEFFSNPHCPPDGWELSPAPTGSLVCTSLRLKEIVAGRRT